MSDELLQPDLSETEYGYPGSVSFTHETIQFLLKKDKELAKLYRYEKPLRHEEFADYLALKEFLEGVTSGDTAYVDLYRKKIDPFIDEKGPEERTRSALLKRFIEVAQGMDRKELKENLPFLDLGHNILELIYAKQGGYEFLDSALASLQDLHQITINFANEIEKYPEVYPFYRFMERLQKNDLEARQYYESFLPNVPHLVYSPTQDEVLRAFGSLAQVMGKDKFEETVGELFNLPEEVVDNFLNYEQGVYNNLKFLKPVQKIYEKRENEQLLLSQQYKKQFNFIQSLMLKELSSILSKLKDLIVFPYTMREDIRDALYERSSSWRKTINNNFRTDEEKEKLKKWLFLDEFQYEDQYIYKNNDIFKSLDENISSIDNEIRHFGWEHFIEEKDIENISSFDHNTILASTFLKPLPKASIEQQQSVISEGFTYNPFLQTPSHERSYMADVRSLVDANNPGVLG